jgi:hypothetical protein
MAGAVVVYTRQGTRMHYGARECAKTRVYNDFSKYLKNH